MRRLLACASLLLLAAAAHGATCPVAGGPHAATGVGDVIFASENPDPLTAAPTGPGAVDGAWQVYGPAFESASVDPSAPRAFVELDCGALGEPACDGSHVPVGAPADGTWTIAFAPETESALPEYVHWRIAGKRGVARRDNPLVGAWVFNQHDADTLNPVGTSIEYSVTTPELSTLPSDPTLPPVFAFNPGPGERTCNYRESSGSAPRFAGAQWCNSDREFGDPNEQSRVAARQLQTASSHAEHCVGTAANLSACLEVWPYVATARNEFYDEGERFALYWTNREGTRLHATLYTPAGVKLQNLNQVASQPGFGGFPTVSIAGGIITNQTMYYWIGDHLARHGYVVMLYDTAGQGRSNAGGGGADPDLQDTLDFLVSRPSSPYPHHDPLQDPHPYNPLWRLVDADRLGIVGHSMGGGAVNAVQVSDAHRVKGAVIYGASGPPDMDVPFMIQSADNDDFVFPTGSNFGQAQYDTGFDAADPQPRFVLQIKDSTHLGWSQGPFIYYTCEHADIAEHYTLAWLDRFVKGGTPAEIADAEARLGMLFDPDADDGRPAADYYSDASCTRLDLDADGQSRTLRNEPGADCPTSAGQSNSPTFD